MNSIRNTTRRHPLSGACAGTLSLLFALSGGSLFFSSAAAAAQTIKITPLPVEEQSCQNAVRNLKLSRNGRYATYSPTLYDPEGVIGPGCNANDGVPERILNNAYVTHTTTLDYIRLPESVIDSGWQVGSEQTSNNGRYTFYLAQNRTGGTISLRLRDNYLDETEIINQLPDGTMINPISGLAWIDDGQRVQFLKRARNTSGNQEASRFVYDIASRSLVVIDDPLLLAEQYYNVDYDTVDRRSTSADGRYVLVGYDWGLARVDTITKQYRTMGSRPGLNTRPELSGDGNVIVINDTTQGTGYTLDEQYLVDLTGPNQELPIPNRLPDTYLSETGRYAVFFESMGIAEPDLEESDRVTGGIYRYDRQTQTVTRLLARTCLIAYRNNISPEDPRSCSISGRVYGLSDDGNTILYTTAGEIGEYRIKPMLLTISADDGAQGYSDVPASYWGFDAINRLDEAGIAGQCNQDPRQFCPDRGLRHDVAAQWLVKAVKGADYVPPAAQGLRFTDVPADWWAARWIEEIDRLGIDRGYGRTFQPTRILSRAQLAFFVGRAKYGPAFTPPPAQGVFDDVPATHWAAAWIELLYSDGTIPSGCDGGTDRFCPGRAARRANVAVYLTRGFSL